MPAPAVISMIYDGKVKVTFSPGRHTYSVDIPGVIRKGWFPSVTGILGTKAKPQLVNWAAKQALGYVAKRLGAFESSQGAPPFLLDTREIHSWISDGGDGWKEDPAASIGSLAHRFLEAEVKHRAGLGSRPMLPIQVDPVLAPEYTPGMVEAANASVRAGIEFLNDHEVEPLMLERVLFSPTDAYIGTCDFYGKIDGKLAIADWKTSRAPYPEYHLQTAAYAKAVEEEFGTLPLERYVIVTKKDGGLEWVQRGVDTYQEDLDAFRACHTLYNWERSHDPWKKGIAAQPLPAAWRAHA